MRRRVINSAPLPKELRDRYFFIDYLRLHRFGKRNGIWKKNRNMLVKDHEYSDDAPTKARKGYESYIQRCLKSILDNMYSDFPVIKPRRAFSYEIGSRENRLSSILNITNENSSEEKIKFIIERYLNNGEYADIVLPYRDIVQNSSLLSFKNNETGIKITLDKQRSLGYEAIKDLVRVRSLQDQMIAIVNNKDKMLIALLAEGMDKARSLPKGTRVMILNENGTPSQVYGNILTHNVTMRQTGSDTRIEIAMETEGRRNETQYPNRIRIIRGNEEDTPITDNALNSGGLTERVLQYCLENLSDSRNLDANIIFTLAKSAIIRELGREGDMESATILRRLDPDQSTLDRINEIVNIEEVRAPEAPVAPLSLPPGIEPISDMIRDAILNEVGQARLDEQEEFDNVG